MNWHATCHCVEGHAGGPFPAAEYSEQAGSLNLLDGLEARSVMVTTEPKFSAPGEDRDNASKVEYTELSSGDSLDAIPK